MRIASRTCRSRRSGQILVIALLSMTLLVAVIFYVYNLGDQVNKRMALQDAADATAISGSAWMARSLNVVAMNNCAQSRVLANIPIQDAFPLATRMALDEVREWEQCLSAQLARGLPNRHGEGNMLRQGVESLRRRMADQRDILAPFDATLSQIQMETYTHWAVRGWGGNLPHGGFWRAAVELERFSRAEAESCGVLAQANAVRFGQPNGVEAGFMVPLIPEMPALRGRFTDFQGVLEGKEYVDGTHVEVQATGGPGGAIVDAVFPHRLGPWARLFRWRNYIREATGWTYVPPSAPTGPTGPVVRVRGGGGAVGGGGRRVGGSAAPRSSGGGGGGGGGGWVPTAWQTLGYTTYGPYAWAKSHIHDYAVDVRENGRIVREGHLPDTFFSPYVHSIADIKMGYMFGPKTPREIHYPIWKTAYPQARQLAERPDVRVTRTMFYLVEVASSVPPTAGNWLSPGTFRTNGERPIAIWFDGWVDPEGWRIPRVSNYVWNDKYLFEVTQDPEIGIYEKIDPATGEPIWQPVYMSAWYIFGGIDVGGEVEVSNPCNWDGDEDLPRPWVFDTTAGDYDPLIPHADEGFRRERFSFLGLVRRNNVAAVWPQQFSHAHPLGDMVALSQSIVFNQNSFDLWTQDWQTQLAPLTKWEQWHSRLSAEASDAARTRGQVRGEDVEFAVKFLESVPPDLVRRFRRN